MGRIRIICSVLSLLCVAVLLLSSLGVSALWRYFDDAEPVTLEVGTSLFEWVDPIKAGLYITDVTIQTSSGVGVIATEYILPTQLKTNVSMTGRNATITYKITVRNDTDMTYWYLGPVYDRSVNSNGLIGNGVTITTRDLAASNSTNFDTEDWVPPKSERTFYATYTFSSSVQGNVPLLSDDSFGLHMASVSDAFLKVLNDKNSEYGYNYLANAFNTKYTETGSTVIANIGSEASIFTHLFGANLSLNVDGEMKPATIMVERKNVDNSTSSGDAYSTGNLKGCEYTVYVTVDDLKTGQPTVYAVSYTCDENGVWRQIGELYEGKCTTMTDYDSKTEGQQPAFNVDSWLAVKKQYTVVNGVKYEVGYEHGQFDWQDSIEELMTVKDTDFYNSVNNAASNLLKPVCQIIYRYSWNNNAGRWDEFINEKNEGKAGYEQLKAAFDKIKPHSLINNGGFERLLNADRLSRAELVPLLEEIQHAYDYYRTLNPNG